MALPPSRIVCARSGALVAQAGRCAGTGASMSANVVRLYFSAPAERELAAAAERESAAMRIMADLEAENTELRRENLSLYAMLFGGRV